MNTPPQMSAMERNQYRHAILLQLCAARPASLITDVLAQGLHLSGFLQQNSCLLAQELDYLCQKSFIRQAHNILSPGIKRYKLTDKGQDYLEREKLI